MRYFRILTNAIAGGVLVASYLTVLVLQLNPQVRLLSHTALRWWGAMMAFYAPYMTVVLFFLMMFWEVVSSRPLRPAWISVRLLAWLGALGAGAAAAITWKNLDAFRAVLTDTGALRMRDGAIATTLAAALLLAIAMLRYSFGRRGTRAAAILLVLTTALSVTVPLWLRGPGETPVRPPRRWSQPARVVGAAHIRVLLLDGASLGFIRQRVAAAQLPSFGRLMDRGASIDLATVRPTEIDPVWAAAATGKLAQQNGIRSNASYRVSDQDDDAVDVLPDYCFCYALVTQGFVRAMEHSATSLRARTVWDILGDYGITSGIVNWPLTYPARAPLGYILSDRFDEAASSPLRLADARAGDPTTAVDVARETFDDWQARPWYEVLTTFMRGEVEPIDINRARWDRAYSDTAAVLEQQFAPRLTVVRYEGLEAFGHTYLRQAKPELFGDPRSAAPQRSVLDRYYGYLDAEVGRAARQLEPGDLLMVISGFGMEATPLPKRLLAQILGDRELTGTHESGPDGFVLAYGANVALGHFPRGAVGDIAPTLLYYLGVPVGRDMDGSARTDLFQSTFAMEHPVKYVASHEK
ncbi:MAG: alkaline phosphatase family protein [Vicinamibacterales bacterium]